MKVAIYARVSKGDQNPEVQLSELRSYAAYREFEIVGEYVDEVTGNMWRRRRLKRHLNFSRLMDAAAKKEFDAVLVWKYDRFARSVYHLIESLRYFDSLGIAFISSTQQFDTSTAHGRMIFQIMASFSEYERELISERTKTGLRLVKKSGRYLGPYRNKKPYLKVDEKSKDRIVEMYLAGVPVKQFASKENITIRHVHRILKRTVCRIKSGHAEGHLRKKYS